MTCEPSLAVIYDRPSLAVIYDRPSLAVIYDDRCELCRRCHRWLAAQESIVPLRFLAASDPVAVTWLGDRLPIGQELVAVDHTGAVWVGPDAFIAVLSVLARYTSLAQRLQKPMLRPLARQAFHAVSVGRGTVSGLLGSSGDGPHPIPDDVVAAQLVAGDGDGGCVADSCALPDR